MPDTNVNSTNVTPVCVGSGVLSSQRFSTWMRRLLLYVSQIVLLCTTLPGMNSDTTVPHGERPPGGKQVIVLCCGISLWHEMKRASIIYKFRLKKKTPRKFKQINYIYFYNIMLWKVVYSIDNSKTLPAYWGVSIISVWIWSFLKYVVFICHILHSGILSSEIPSLC